MLGPTFGHTMATLMGLVLIEKLVLHHVLAPHAAWMGAIAAALGKTWFTFWSSLISSTISFWGFGFIFAVPALLQVEKGKIQVNRSLDCRALLGALPLVMFNFLAGNILGVAVFLAFLPDSSFDFNELPDTSTLIRHAAIWMVLQELSFFYVHKFFHENKRAYAAIHKLHHTWTAPVSWVAIYCHPVEHIVANICPVILGPVLLGSHVAAILMWTTLGLIHTTAVHSGFWICDDNGMHDEHHRKFNVNYGVSGILDVLHGTYQLPHGAVDHTNHQSVAEKKNE